MFSIQLKLIIEAAINRDRGNVHFCRSFLSFLLDETIVAPPHVAHSCGELYLDPTKNPFGIDDETKEICYSAIYEVWRCTHDPLPVEKLHQNILAGFSWSVGRIGVFVWDGDSPTGVLQIMYGVANFHGAPG
jgi:hypothetical protein